MSSQERTNIPIMLDMEWAYPVVGLFFENELRRGAGVADKYLTNHSLGRWVQALINVNATRPNPEIEPVDVVSSQTTEVRDLTVPLRSGRLLVMQSRMTSMHRETYLGVTSRAQPEEAIIELFFQDTSAPREPNKEIPTRYRRAVFDRQYADPLALDHAAWSEADTSFVAAHSERIVAAATEISRLIDPRPAVS